MIRQVWLATACMVCGAAVGAAQEPLTLERAVQAAIARNSGLHAARARSAEAAAHVEEARAGWMPRVTVTEFWQRGDEPVFVFGSLLASRHFAAANFALDALNHPAPINFFQTSFGIEQTLFDGGRQRAAVRSATLTRDIADLEADAAAAGLAVRVTETFGRVLVAQASGRAAEAAFAAAREDQLRAERRRDSGLATDADALALAAQAAGLQQRLIQARGDLAIARAELNRLIGEPVDQEYDVLEPIAAVVNSVDADTPLSALFAEAAQARPEARRAAAAGLRADAERARARAGFIPQVAAQGAFDVSGTEITSRASAWAVGGTLRWNLSLGGAERAELTAAVEGAAQANSEADDVRAAIQVDVISALRRLEAARARQEAGRAAVDQARESQRITRDRYDAGVAAVTDVLRASSIVLDAEAQRISALVDAIVGDAMLRRALGRRP